MNSDGTFIIRLWVEHERFEVLDVFKLGQKLEWKRPANLVLMGFHQMRPSFHIVDEAGSAAGDLMVQFPSINKSFDEEGGAAYRFESMEEFVIFKLYWK